MSAPLRRKVRFVKMNAGGNDFVVFDNREKRLPGDLAALARLVCRRKVGIGADGILVLENSARNNFKMIYFNADGSRASMCGNGARCMALFAYRVGAAPADMWFDTDAGIHRAEVAGDQVRLHMRPPKDIELDIRLPAGKKTMTIHSVDTGVPHAVVFVRDAGKADVDGIGRMIRFHRRFKPAGTNVDFVARKNSRQLIIRTFERGVDGETDACGTGVTASAVIALLRKMVRSPVKCLTHGGDVLTVSASLDAGSKEGPFSDVCLEGRVAFNFDGFVKV